MRYLAAFLSLVLPAAAQSVERIDRDERCSQCHVDQAEASASSVHARSAVGCISCHGADDVNTAQTRGNPHRRIGTFRGYRRQAIADDCGSCHIAVLEAMRPSGHYAKTVAGGDDPKRMRGCLECHEHHATRKAIRSEIALTCVRCHAEGTSDLMRGRDFLEAADRLDADLARATQHLATQGGRPAIDPRPLAAARADGLAVLTGLRVRQHGVDFDALETDRARAAEALRLAYDSLSAREQEFTRRWLWLTPFLALTALSYVLVRAKTQRLQKGA